MTAQEEFQKLRKIFEKVQVQTQSFLTEGLEEESRLVEETEREILESLERSRNKHIIGKKIG